VILIKVDIIGGSFAGLSTAISIKKNNPSIKVVIHEKHKKIGYNPEGRRCGEAHSVEQDWKKWAPVGKSIFNEIKTGEIIIRDKKYTAHRKPGVGYMLNRQEFICQIARDAEKLGVNIQTHDRIKSYTDLDGNYIVDASGCPSSVKKEINIDKGLKAHSYQQSLEYSNKFVADKLTVIFTGDPGYFWIFPRNPKKKEINLGCGILGKPEINIKKRLEDFKIKQDITGTVNYRIGGLIPLGLQRPFKYKNILFVGDSCVGTFPFTGQGIYRSLLNGEYAGKCIAKEKTDSYSKVIIREFIKWDLIGKTFLYPSIILTRINPSLVLSHLNNYVKRFNLNH